MNSLETLRALQASRMETLFIKNALWNQAFLGPSWWFIAITIAISYVIWWKLIDKKRIIEILLFGCFIAVSRVIFDDWGVSTVRWTYIIDLFPLGISLFLNDLTIVPLFYMLVYQSSATWKKYFAAICILQSVISFAFLPLLTKIGILELINWHYAYTFIFMIITAIVMRTIMILGLRMQKGAIFGYIGNTSKLIPQPALKRLSQEHETKNSSKRKDSTLA